MAPFEEVEATFWEAQNKRMMLPPLTADLIAEAERQLGVALPADLIHLLRIQNGGVVAPAWDACPAEPNAWAGDHVPFEHELPLAPGFRAFVERLSPSAGYPG
ncbi:SMI1/KNR4 family protein [Dactylosporangium salmoneum]|uniref:Knr4/Smi1-like domain-containing protein n=1 Tax=Dactylosporangium salmoneum TaxID=53361 RepID=A0ABN3G2V2_9ACTN